MVYFDNIDEIIEIHAKTIEFSGGGALGIMNKQYLESVIEFIKDDNYYPNFEDKLTHLFWSLNKNHSFQDGNKRIAIVVCSMFIHKNGYLKMSERFLHEMEIISYHVAANNIDKTLLHKIISSFLYEDDYSEELKLELANAIKE
jgi:death on curing protein